MTGIAERHDKAGHRLLPYEPFSEEGARVPVLLWPRAEDISNEYTIANPSNLSLEFADMVECEEISTPFILWNLRKRFKNNKIYTNIANILISINPFKFIDGVYSDELMAEVKMKSETGDRLPPHVYCQAASAYRGLRDHQEAQAMLISGESGAGKTEATKRCLNYFVKTAKAKFSYEEKDKPKQGPSSMNVEERILGSNPILEGFGNAKTNRNNNSSRFGKWMEVYFMREEGCVELAVAGCGVEDYLLETSRVTDQADGERNFHIFYQLCAMFKDDDSFGITGVGAESFHYLGSGRRDIIINGTDDKQDMEEMLIAMNDLGFETEEIASLQHIVAALLHCGNISFQPSEGAGSDGSVVDSSANSSVEQSARLLGIQASSITENLTTKPLQMVGSARHESITTQLNPEKAAAARDSLAKAAYGRLFKWLVKRVNEALRPKESVRDFVLHETPIGILDIFGFEIFEHNRFEQLCINYANEKLQQHFTRHVFKMQEQLYADEGIDFSFPHYDDNSDILALIESKKSGIMPLLDEHLNMPSPSDALYLKAVISQSKGNPRFKASRMNDNTFTIVHYAGPVTYDTDGFIAKNRANLDQHLQDMLHSSSITIVQNLGNDPLEKKSSSKSKSGHGVKKRETQLSYFQKSLENLMNILGKSEPHFIRCIKPNGEKKPNLFECVTTLEQLQYSGVVEAVQICKMGFPFRRTHEQFQLRYRHLTQRPTLREPHLISQADMMDFKQLLISAEDKRRAASFEDADNQLNIFKELQVGKTLILYRVEQHHALESLRFAIRDKKVIFVQTVARRMICRKLVRQMLLSRTKIKKASVEKNRLALSIAIADSKKLRFPLPELDKAIILLDRLEAAEKLREEMKEFIRNERIISTKTPEEVVSKKEHALRMIEDAKKYEIENEVICSECNRALDHLQVQLSMILKLRQALAESQKDEIADLLKTIEENIEGITGPFCVDLKEKAISELGRIEDEMIRVNDVIKALADGALSLNDSIDPEVHNEKITELPLHELFKIQSIKVDELNAEVLKLAEFDPRTEDGKSMIKLGNTVSNLRLAVMNSSWEKIKAAVVDINTCTPTARASATSDIRAAQIAIDLRDSIPEISLLLKQNMITEDLGVGEIKPADVQFEHLVSAVEKFDQIGTCTRVANSLLGQLRSLARLRQYWHNSDWDDMDHEIKKVQEAEENSLVSKEITLAKQEIYDRRCQIKFLELMSTGKMTGSADHCDSSQIAFDGLKLELVDRERERPAESTAMKCIAFTAKVIVEVI